MKRKAEAIDSGVRKAARLPDESAVPSQLTGCSFFDARRKVSQSAGNTRHDYSKLESAVLGFVADYKAVVQSLPDPLADTRARISKQLSQNFAKWILQLRSGFNLLFYGVGSKRGLLDEFARKHVPEDELVTVDGRQGHVSGKSILAYVAASLSGGEPSELRSSPERALLSQVRELSQRRAVHLIIHSLDARALQCPGDLAIISALAAIRGVRVAASVDHVNAAMLFDSAAWRRGRWLWAVAHTFAPLHHETRCAEPVLSAPSATAVQNSAGVVLETLTRTSRMVFRTLAEALLGELLDPDEEVSGITYEHLFRLVRERMLVSNDGTLRAHLTEFKDHGLIKTRRTDLGDVMYIPMTPAALEQLVTDLDEGA